MRVPRFACQRRHVVRTEAIEERMGRRPLHENLAHVTHVEQADGDYVVWEAFFGFLAVLGGGFYFVDTIRKEREFDRLISTPSKEVFVKNMGRIEELTYDHLPSAYERRFLDKKREFRIKG